MPGEVTRLRKEEGSAGASAGTSFNQGVRVSWVMMTMESQRERPTLNCCPAPPWTASDQMTRHPTLLMKFLYRSTCCAPEIFMTESPYDVIDPSFGPRHGQRLSLMMEEGEFVLEKSSADTSSLKKKFAGAISRNS